MAQLLCAHHQCEVSIQRNTIQRPDAAMGNAIYQNPNSLLLELDENGRVIHIEHKSVEGSQQGNEPWRESMEDSVYNPLSHYLRWDPTLRFTFTHPSVSL